MSGRNMGFRLVMLPPQTEITRGWAARLAAEVPEAEVVVAEDMVAAEAEDDHIQLWISSLEPLVDPR